MDFETRYDNLNTAQQEAVDTIDGPLLVVAGPGTGKTELLSMRVANILRQTDTGPANILCLTFTDSGVTAMQNRLAEIIGADAYKVAIHTFHSFGTEVINQNSQYFYHGAGFRPADDIASYQILTEIFDELDYSNPLASKFNGKYTHLKDAQKSISELKKAGLSSDELLAIVDDSVQTLDLVEADLGAIFADKISKSIISKLPPIAQKVAAIDTVKLPLGITPLANVLALSMAHAFDEAVKTGKTNAITAWKNKWLERDSAGKIVFKDRKRLAKLHALAHVYFAYINRMEQAGLYDYEDMILNVIHAMEVHPDLRYNLQEKYSYFLVDEFQDTNLAQLRILLNLTTNNLSHDTPNIMAVGDDDQAIYSFQGADVSNIHRFREAFPELKSIVLTENYRSGQPILDSARAVITQGADRLEASMEISKQLHAHEPIKTTTEIISHPRPTNEKLWLTQSIAADIKAGTKPSDIAVLARKHHELIDLLPYFSKLGINVNYEKNDDILELEPIKTLELMSRVVTSIYSGQVDEIDYLMPELLCHPMFDFAPETIWKVSLESYQNRKPWLDAMQNAKLSELRNWLIELATLVPHTTLETMLDTLIGAPQTIAKSAKYASPFFDFYFGATNLEQNPAEYIHLLEALKLLRQTLREFQPEEPPRLTGMLECIDLHRQISAPIKLTTKRSDRLDDAVNLLSAHKSKGLEFETVYIINAIDSMWGESARSRSRSISYPENLNITPGANKYDDNLRLFYVAMTRAKSNLKISFAESTDAGKPQTIAAFLVESDLERSQNHLANDSIQDLAGAEISWRQTVLSGDQTSLRQLLESTTLRDYKLSATHLNSFIDLYSAGPSEFLINHLLHFPSAKSANASFGSAIHRALERAHVHFISTNERRPIEDTLGDFLRELSLEHLSPDDFEHYKKRGSDCLSSFLSSSSANFTSSQQTELNFNYQAVTLGQAKLTGKLDLVDISDNKIAVTDYKTGKPSHSWKGSGGYEPVKLHKYRQQLMFYQLLCRGSRDYAKFQFDRGILQFVEPDSAGQICSLDATFTDAELDQFSQLIAAVWYCITHLEFPDTTEFTPTLTGIKEFEQFLIDKYSKKI